jgi:hypothetical protein
LGPMSSAMYIGFTLVHWHVRVEEYIHLNGHRVSNLVSYLHVHERAWSIFLYVDEIWLHLFMGHQPSYILDKANE